MKACLVVVQGKPMGMEIPLTGSRFLVGRDPACHLRPRNEKVSKRHCVFDLADSGVSITDLGSTNGTYVNGQRVQGVVPLRSNDLVKIGPLVFEIQITAPLDRQGERGILDWLAEAGDRPSDNTVTNVPVSVDGGAGDTVLTNPKKPAPNPVEPSTTPDKPADTASAASNILQKYLDRRRS